MSMTVLDQKQTQPTLPVACPYCKSDHTECVALFGPKLLTSQYYCRACHSAFEVVRADDGEESA
jgi:transposase-like protein